MFILMQCFYCSHEIFLLKPTMCTTIYTVLSPIKNQDFHIWNLETELQLVYFMCGNLLHLCFLDTTNTKIHKQDFQLFRKKAMEQIIRKAVTLQAMCRSYNKHICVYLFYIDLQRKRIFRCYLTCYWFCVWLQFDYIKHCFNWKHASFRHS